MNSKKLLQTGGLMFIIEGTAVAVLLIISVADGSSMSTTSDAIGIAAGVYHVIVGIIALVTSSSPKRAVPIQILSTIVMVLYIACMATNEESEAVTYVIFAIFGFVLPAVMIRSAYLTRKAS